MSSSPLPSPPSGYHYFSPPAKPRPYPVKQLTCGHKSEVAVVCCGNSFCEKCWPEHEESCPQMKDMRVKLNNDDEEEESQEIEENQSFNT